MGEIMSDPTPWALTREQVREILYLLRHIETDREHAAAFIKEVLANDAAQRARIEALEQDFYEQQWLHAACLTIAEGTTGWDRPLANDSLATKTVRGLRQQLAQVTQERNTFKEALEYEANQLASRDATITTLQGEVEKLEEQQRNTWLRFTVCTSHDDFLTDLDTLLLEAFQAKEQLTKVTAQRAQLQARDKKKETR